MDIFGLMYEKYKITKPIRLIELFGGYGSQHFALKYLGLNVEQWKLVEWAVPSIQAYKDAHFTNDNFDYSSMKSFETIVQILFDKGISSNYNDPMTYEQIKRKGENWCKQVFNNICATNNLVNIQKVKGEYLQIVDSDKYEYIMTYSFPCQDLSLAGKRAGMSDTSTRSGMLWEVERILDELDTKPQILLMENVPQVIGKDNVEHFNKWVLKLEGLGYKNHHQNLIATDYGIPQTRNRTFMVSILGDYSYTFPQPIPLKLKLKDMLKDEVDEKYYLSEAMKKYIFSEDDKYKVNKNSLKLNREIACSKTTREGNTRADTSDYLIVPEATKKGYAIAQDGDGVYIQNIKGKRGMVQKGKIQTLKTQPDVGVVIGTYDYAQSDTLRPTIEDRLHIGKEVSGALLSSGNQNGLLTNNLRIRKLTPKECFRLMGVKDEDYEKIAKNQSNASLYHLAGDSIVVNVLMAIVKELI